jgi:hypothetical protein
MSIDDAIVVLLLFPVWPFLSLLNRGKREKRGFKKRKRKKKVNSVKMEDVKEKQSHDMRFDKGSTHLLVGPSACGKTVRVCRIVANKDAMFVGGKDIKNVVFCYAVWQDIYQDMKDRGVITKFVNKMPNVEEFTELVADHKDKGGSIIILDDFMQEICHDLVSIVTVHSRHYNTSTFILFQSLFPSNRLARQISLNVKYIHVHKNPRDLFQFQVLARQLSPKDYKWLIDVYHTVTKEQYTSLLIDMTQQRREPLRIRSHYLPQELPMRVWYSRKESGSIQELV